MEITEDMLVAAMKKAVETGVIPRRTVDGQTYLKTWEAMKEILQAALDA